MKGNPLPLRILSLEIIFQPNVPTQSNLSNILVIVGTFHIKYALNTHTYTHTALSPLTGHPLPPCCQVSHVCQLTSPTFPVPTNTSTEDRNSSSRCREREPLLRIERGGAGALPHWLGAPCVLAKIGFCWLKIESERSREKKGEGELPVVRLSSGSATAETHNSEYRTCRGAFGE